MPDDDSTTENPTSQDPGTPGTESSETTPRRRPSRRRSASRPAGPPPVSPEVVAPEPATASAEVTEPEFIEPEPAEPDAAVTEPPVQEVVAPVRPVRARRSRKTAVAAPPVEPADVVDTEAAVDPEPSLRQAPEVTPTDADDSEAPAAPPAAGVPTLVFQPPKAVTPRPARKAVAEPVEDDELADETSSEAATDESDTEEQRPARRRRRGGRGRNRSAASDATDGDESPDAEVSSTSAEAGESATDGQATGEPDPDAAGEDTEESGTGTGTRRRRRRRRGGGGGGGGGSEAAEGGSDDPPNTVVHVREPRRKSEEDSVKGVKGSTRLEAKKQRRREGRDSGRRRPSIVTEAEFLARREAVDRVMVVRQGTDRTQIGVLEDGVLVEHYVARRDAGAMVGNVYLGKVQNVLPSMEAAFVDIGRGRNAVLYAGEVNYDASGLDGKPQRIEQALKSGQTVLVQVTKDPIGHKGARLTSQVSLPGRYMVYVPDGRLSGISRKLPDTERTRLKSILKKLTPEDAGVIVRTAAEGASEEALERDLTRLKAQWDDIAAKSTKGSAPSMIYGEPELVIRVVRDIFNEDFTELVVQGADEWDTIDNYVRWVAPDLANRTRRWDGEDDLFAAYRVDEQLAKALDRKVWLPSGGYLVIDRTEAMIVVDVNTGKFTGRGGGNLEETVTRNNIEAAEEIVRQLRLRDLGGIIVVDFIDMVLESNRELVMRRLLECLGRDRTRHQVAEVTSLGLVQMTRKRVGEGLLEAFSQTCAQCQGSGVVLTEDPVAKERPEGHQHATPVPAPAPEAPSARRRSSGSAPNGRSSGGRGRRSPAAESSTSDSPASDASLDAVDTAVVEGGTLPDGEADREPQPV